MAGWKWTKVAQIRYHLEDNELHLAIPLAATCRSARVLTA